MVSAGGFCIKSLSFEFFMNSASNASLISMTGNSYILTFCRFCCQEDGWMVTNMTEEGIENGE